MSPESILKITDHAAQASDRWLFLAVLILLLAFGGLSLKWLIANYEARTKKLETDLDLIRKEQIDYLKTTGTETLKTLLATQEILKDCASALSDSARMSERKLEVIQRLETRMAARP